MSGFDRLMAQTGLPALRRVFGDAAVYTPPYTPPEKPAPVNTWAIMGTDAALVGQYTPRLEPRLTAELPVAEVPHPAIGATLVVGSTPYRIDQVLDRTAYTVLVALRASA